MDTVVLGIVGLGLALFLSLTGLLYALATRG